MELVLRNRIATVKEVRKRPFPERIIEVIDDKNTGEVILFVFFIFLFYV